MNLLLDIGNTSLRWAVQPPGDPPGPPTALRHGGGMPPDLLAAWEGLAPPARIRVSQVGDPALRTGLERVTRALWGLEPRYASVQDGVQGVRVAYADPARLGADRWLALLAARAMLGASGQPALILDAGTAATFDLLLADGEHLGGLILPGLAALRAALLAGARLPLLEPVAPEPPGAAALVLGRDTGAAVALGGIQALAALASRLYDRLADRTGATPRFLLTGGDAETLRPALDRPCEPAPDLVLRGLAGLADSDLM